LHAQCLLQLRRRVFDFGVAILASSGLRREQPAPMNIFEIAIGELIPSFGMLVFLFVNPQIPFTVFIKSVLADKLILLLCGRLVFAPRLPFV